MEVYTLYVLYELEIVWVSHVLHALTTWRTSIYIFQENGTLKNQILINSNKP